MTKSGQHLSRYRVRKVRPREYVTAVERSGGRILIRDDRRAVRLNRMAEIEASSARELSGDRMSSRVGQEALAATSDVFGEPRDDVAAKPVGRSRRRVKAPHGK